ncbi:MAG: GDSL-type esterase/lipase family protein [Bacteroidota bacterium]
MNRSILLSSLLFICVAAYSQPEITDSANRISLAKPLMVETQETVFKVVHIGDSHIQADWFSGRLRDLLQQHYGNAGKGLIFPYRQIKTNPPNTFSTFSNVPFQSAKMVRCRSACNVGIAAYDAYMQRGNSLAVSLKRDTSMQFVSALYHTEENDHAVIFNSDNDTANYTIQRTGDYVIASYKKQVPPTFSLQVKSAVTLNGIIASNGRPGVLYYTIGANGATFSNYNNAALFFKQLSSLQADLVIVSLGTNESVSDMPADTFYNYINTFYMNLAASCGHTNFMFTIPADNYRRRVSTTRKKVKGKWRKKRVVSYVNNTKVEEIRNTMVAFCNDKNVMYWDLYAAMGGKGSMKSWVHTGYAAKDHIHFSKAGYELQGELLFKALQRIIINL